MNELKVFSNSEFGELGVMLIDGKEYFPATQCAAILGYASPKDAITRHCKGALKRRLPTNGGTQDVKYIPEGDLYRLIVSSKLPQAEKFERWVFDEVLPSIRKNGGYAVNVEEIIAKTATAVVSELVKQLVPVITQIVAEAVSCASVKIEPFSGGVPPITPDKPVAKKCRGHEVNTGTIWETLDKETQKKAYEMMKIGNYSSLEISHFIHEKTGTHISLTTLCRYKRNWFNITD